VRLLAFPRAARCGYWLSRAPQGAAIGFPTPQGIDLGPRSLTLTSGTLLSGQLRLRAFPFGVISLLLDVPIDTPASLDSLVPRCADAWDAPELDDLARTELDALNTALQPFLQGPRRSPIVESYGVLFLARVYLSALRRVHVPLWRDSVNRKLTAFREVYAVLKADAETRRARLLELVIALLIAFEVVWALLHDR